MSTTTVVSHRNPFACTPSTQSADFPVQRSTLSHGPAAARQTVVAGRNASGGHAALAPVQVSSTSQGPALLRHGMPLGSIASPGQTMEVPSQTSSRSHGPVDGRQTVPAASGSQLAPASQLAHSWFDAAAAPSADPGDPSGPGDASLVLADPAGPVGPVGPVGPAGPTAPGGPVGPVAPVGPVGPVDPAGPGDPAGPTSPVPEHERTTKAPPSAIQGIFMRTIIHPLLADQHSVFGPGRPRTGESGGVAGPHVRWT
jgi:hypothetical protein